MKANELRIGNLVLKYGSEILITPYDLINIELSLNEYEPITLTEEWLLKFGADFDDITYQLGCLLLASNCDCFNVWYCTLTYGKLGIKINYVHQLQNLYFALTGEELQVKELESDKGYKPEDTINVDLNFTITDIEEHDKRIKASQLNDDALKEGKITLEQYLKNKDVIGL